MKACPPLEFSVKRFRAGDKAAFDLLFRQLYAALCYFAEGMVHDTFIAEELTQNAFIKLWDKRKGFTSFIKIRAFLYIAIKNEAINHIKKEKNRLKTTERLSLDTPLSENDITDQLIYTEIKLILDKAISALPDRCKTVIEMSYLYEKTSKEIAEAMGTSISTVDNQRARGIQLLKKSLTKVGLLYLLFLFI